MNTHAMSEEEADLRARWRPTDTAVRHAVALLNAEPAADLAAIPMVQPGKTYGCWRVGEQVETVPGAVFLGVNSFDVPEGSPVPSYSLARHWASEVARAHLGDREGTVSWVTVRRDGNWSVSEDILGASEEAAPSVTSEQQQELDTLVERLPDDALVERIIDQKCEEASRINNDGPAARAAYLVEAFGVHEALELLRAELS